LALIVLRRDAGAPLSDENWTRWTGYESRIKLNAIAGLRKKGLRVDGRGDRARYSWDSHTWNHYLRAAPVGERARTEGRAESKAAERPMHPQCVEHGCQMMAGKSREKSKDSPQLVDVTFVESKGRTSDVAQPVAQIEAPFVSPNVQQTAASSSPLNRGDDAAKEGSELERIWAKALGALRIFFPLVGMVFLVRLLAAVRAVFPDVTDAELAKAVGIAFHATNRRQKSEGLFLLTVPEALADLRRRPPPKVVEDKGRSAETADRVAAWAEQLKARGQPYSSAADRVGELAAELLKGGDSERIERIELALSAIEGEVVEIAAGARTAEQRAATIERVEKEVERYRKPPRALAYRDLARIERQFRDRFILEQAGLPRLSLFYA
jgi:hypothetical protein